jgi:hypothetical protein
MLTDGEQSMTVRVQTKLDMLSKIENGQISPSLASLQALATALNVPLTTFFTTFEEKRDCSFVKAGTGVRIERRGTKAGHQYSLLGHALGGAVVVEPYPSPCTKMPPHTPPSSMRAPNSSTCSPAR